MPHGTATAPTTVTFSPSACYRIEGTLELAGRSNLSIVGGRFMAFGMGPGGTGKFSNRDRAHWRAEASTNISFTGTSVQGPVDPPTYSADTEAQHGFVVSASTNVTLTDVRATNVLGDFVAITNGASNVTVTGGVFSGAGRQGFSVSEGSDIRFENNTLTRVARSAVDVEPLLDWEVHGVTVTRNTFTAPIGNAIFANIGNGAAVSGIAVTNNAVYGVPFTVKAAAPCGQRRSDYTFTGNSSDTPMVLPLGFKRIDGLTISGNTFPVIPLRSTKTGTVGGVWLDLYNVTALTISDNDVGAAQVTTNPDDCRRTGIKWVQLPWRDYAAAGMTWLL